MITPSNKPYELPKANPKTASYIILQGIEELNRFITTNNINEDQTKLSNGKTAYIILGYANTIAEAQMYLYGKVYRIPPRRILPLDFPLNV